MSSKATVLFSIALVLGVPGVTLALDCNQNGVPDRVDIAEGASPDCNSNAVPDECETRVTFIPHEISATVLGARSVKAVDLNGDGDLDILTGAFSGNDVSWFENLDGAGTFGVEQSISINSVEVSEVSTVDVDGDGDLDVLSAEEQRVAWFRNLDGQGNFDAGHTLSEPCVYMTTVSGADLDGDGDNDLVSGAVFGSDGAFLDWFENLDGQGTYSTYKGIDAFSVYDSTAVADIDGDGDIDIVTTMSYSIHWFENDGTGEFSDHLIEDVIPFGGKYLFPADLDGDGDPDLLLATSFNWGVLWYENTDGAGTFAPPQIIKAGIGGHRSIVAADLDGDGDLDAITASEDDDTIAWYENEDGVGGFGDRRLVSLSADGAWSVVAADIDGDGDLDLVSASTNDNRVVWYENQQNDCDGNSVPDECEPDCNLNGIADACDIRSGFSLDCNANGVPDSCDTGCVFACDTDHDGCHDAVDSDPRDPFKCADTDGDGCDDCSSGVFDTATDGQNSDSDGICDAGDCDPFDNEIWFPPQSIDMLTLSQPTESTVLDWRAPPEKGAVHLRYDTLRSSVASDFGAPAVCLVSDSAAPRAEDAEQPDGLFFYLVRVENDCPGYPGAMGAGSDRIPRTGLVCALTFGKCCHDGVVGNMCTVNTELECEASGQFILWNEGGTCEGGYAACDPCNCCGVLDVPGCNCQECVDAVCGADTFCCAVEWDLICADLAISLCSCCEGQDPGACC